MPAADRKDVRKKNQTLILKTILSNEQMSRAEIAKAIHLSAPSVSSNVDQLLEMGMLREVGIGQSVTGRKPILLEIAEDYRVVAAVDLSSNPVMIALSDFRGKLMGKKEIEIEGDRIVDRVFTDIIQELHGLMDEFHVSPEQLYKIGVASPGNIDEETGFYTNAPRVQNFKNVNPSKIFSDEFHVDTVVGNDTNLAALGEWSHESMKGTHNMAYVFADNGIGAGLILNGQVYRGSHGAAGDIGYLLATQADGDVQWFDSVGSIYGMLKSATRMMRERNPELVEELKIPEGKHISFKQFRYLYEKGYPICHEIMECSALAWGKAVANICICLDLDTVVFAGKLSELEKEFMIPVLEYVNQKVPYPVTIQTSNLGAEAALLGTISTIWEGAFSCLVPD